MSYFSYYDWFRLIWDLIADLSLTSVVSGEKRGVEAKIKEAQLAQYGKSKAKTVVQGETQNATFGKQEK